MKSIIRVISLAVVSVMLMGACAASPEAKGEQFGKAMVSALKNGDDAKVDRVSEKAEAYVKDLSLTDKIKFTKAFVTTLADSGYKEISSELEDLFN